MDNSIVPPIIMTTVSAACGLSYGLKRRSDGAMAAAAAGCTVWAAAQLLIFMVPHTVVSFAMRVQGKTKPASLVSMKIAGVDYDFRLYALALLGILFIVQAVNLLRAARAASGQELAASKRVRRSAWNVLLLAVPLAPISPGIPFLTAPAALALLSQHALFAKRGRLELGEARASAVSA